METSGGGGGDEIDLIDPLSGNGVVDLPSIPHPLWMNELVLKNVFKYSTPEEANKYRLVCSEWNYAILDLPKPKLTICTKSYSYAGEQNTLDFQDICNTMDGNLARKLSGFPNDKHIQLSTSMFSDHVQYMSFMFISVKQVPIILKIFELHIPNIKEFTAWFDESSSIFDSDSPVIYHEPPIEEIALTIASIPTKKELRALKIVYFEGKKERTTIADERSAPVTTMAQIIVNAAPNLKDIYFNYVLPDISNINQLEKLDYRLNDCNVYPTSTLITPARLSNMLRQVAPTLKHFTLGNLYGFERLGDAKQDFEMPVMPNLESFRSYSTKLFHSGGVVKAIFGDKLKEVELSGQVKPKTPEDSLESIFDSKFCKSTSLTKLTVSGYGPVTDVFNKLTKAAFPSLRWLMFWAPDNFDETGIQLDTALKICQDLDLKHFKIEIPTPKNLSTFVKILSKHATLFSGNELKTLAINTNGNIFDDWDHGFQYFGYINIMDGLFRDVFTSMSGMDSVEIFNLRLKGQTNQKFQKCIIQNELPIFLGDIPGSLFWM